MSRYIAATGLSVRSWPGQDTAAVFVEGTVSTHLISELAAAVLELAQSEAVNAAVAVDQLGLGAQALDSSAVENESDLQLMEATILSLVSAGFLRPAQ